MKHACSHERAHGLGGGIGATKPVGVTRVHDLLLGELLDEHVGGATHGHTR